MGAEVQSRLYIAATGGNPEDLAQTLKAAAAATLLVRQPAEGKLDAAAARPLLEMAQKLDIAVLIEGDASLARALRADGVHIPWSKHITEQYAEARDILGTRYIVGVDVGRSRHEAMSLAEAGADYIGFGIPAHVEDRETAVARRRELIAWWSEIFEVPCVALDVEHADAAVELASAGADFIGMSSAAMQDAEFAELSRAIAAASQQEELA
jgi:thiamine-phosphate pyrophosphorylase